MVLNVKQVVENRWSSMQVKPDQIRLEGRLQSFVVLRNPAYAVQVVVVGVSG